MNAYRGKEKQMVYLKIFESFFQGLLKVSEKGPDTISVKDIRRANDISNNNRSLINFYWRFLKDLKDLGYLRQIPNSQPKKYKVIDLSSLDLETIKEDILNLKNGSHVCKNPKCHALINSDSPFCSNKCKAKENKKKLLRSYFDLKKHHEDVYSPYF